MAVRKISLHREGEVQFLNTEASMGKPNMTSKVPVLKGKTLNRGPGQYLKSHLGNSSFSAE